MARFYFTVQAPADDHANVGVVNADDAAAAETRLNEVYGNTEENQAVEINLIDAETFNKLQAEYGEELTHKVE